MVPIDALHGGIDRQGREGDPDVDEGDDHRRTAVEQQTDRLIREAQGAEQRVDAALRPQHQLPGHDAKQVADGERDEQEREVEGRPPTRSEIQEVRHRVCQEGGEAGDPAAMRTEIPSSRMNAGVPNASW